MDLAKARAALARDREDGGPATEEAAETRPGVWRNRWTVAGAAIQLRTAIQLRYGRDGRWYPYRLEGGEWWPAAAPGTDAAAVLSRLIER
jgi:hypothetical protein